MALKVKLYRCYILKYFLTKVTLFNKISFLYPVLQFAEGEYSHTKIFRQTHTDIFMFENSLMLNTLIVVHYIWIYSIKNISTIYFIGTKY
jgi:hypothetical protein